MDCWRLRGGEGGSGVCVCALVSVSEARRAAGELENFTAFSEGDLRSEIWRSGAESAASSPAVIDRGGPVRVSALERFPANMDDLGKFARLERNIYTARACVCVLLEQTHDAGVTWISNQTKGFTEVADYSCVFGSAAVCTCPDRLSYTGSAELSASLRAQKGPAC